MLYNLTNEADLIARLQAGEKNAFDVIYKYYWESLYVFARRRTKTDEDAKDLIQDLFVSLWLKRQELTINASLKAYLFISLRNRIINYLQACLTRKEYLAILSQMNQEIGDTSTDNKVAENEILFLLEKSISQLPDKMKEIFELSRRNGFTAEEISTHLNISSQTVRNQVSNAIKRIRISLQDYLPVLLILFFSFI
jgi:RNA polymerase sigma-70 factor (ECF subfamily)